MTARLDIHRTTENGVDHVPLKAGANRVKVVSGRQFKLLDPDGKLDAESLRVLQIETDLVIENIPVDGSEEKATVILEGYYKVCSASDRCEVHVAGSGDAAPVLLADVNAKAIGAQSDGTFVLYDPSFEAPTPPVENTFPVRPVLYGVGGAAVLGLALGGGGGGGSDGAPPIGDIPLALKSGAFFNNRFPTISGTAKPGTNIQLRIDTDDDLRENVTYNTTADAAGNWAVNLQTATPASGALPATGLSNSNKLAVTASLDGVHNSLPLTTMVFDDVLPAAAVIAPAAGDGIITGEEKTAGAVLSGTAEPGASVEIVLGTTTKTATVGPDGKWETTLAAAELPAADGEYTMSVTTVDPAGNRGPTTTSKVIVNATGKAAVIAFVGTDDIINATEAAAPVAVTGTAEAGASVKVTLGGTEQTVTADANGNWRTAFTLPATLADGTHNVAVETTNAIGNKASSTRAFVLDRTAPAKAGGISFDDDRNAGDGFTIGYNASRDGTKVSGQAEAGSKVRVRWGDHVETADVNSNGRWEVSFSPNEMPIPRTGEQSSVVTVTVEDKAGNTSAPEATNVTLQGPEATKRPVIDDIATDNRIDAAEARNAITVSGTAEPGARVVISAGGISATAQAGQDGDWSTTMALGDLANGQYSVSAVATVDGRPASPEATRAITVDKTDRTPPTTPTLSVPEGPDITAEEARDGITVSGTAEAGATVRLTLGDGANAPTTTVRAAAGTGAWTATFTANQMPTVAAGAKLVQTLTAVAEDTAGNPSAPRTTQLTFEGAPTPTPAPTISVISGDDKISSADANSAIHLSGTAEPNATVAITLNGQNYSANAGANGQWTLSNFNLGTLGSGDYTVSAVATAPGRAASTAAARPFSVDKTAPTIQAMNVDDGETISAAEAANGFVVSGTTEAGASVDVSFNGHTRTVEASGTGTWSTTFTPAQMPTLQPGAGASYTLTATPTDDAGNAGTARSMQLMFSGAARPPANADITDISGNNGVSGTEAGSPVPVSGTAEPGANVTLRIGNTPLGSIRASETGDWQTTITLPPAATLPAGTHTLTATTTVTPTGGGAPVTSTDNQTFQLERPVTRGNDPVLPPAAVDIDPISGGTVDSADAASGTITLTGTATAGASVTLTLGSASANTTAGADGKWSTSISIPADLANGSHTVTATLGAGTGARTATSTESFVLNRVQEQAPPPADDDAGTGGGAGGAGGNAGSNTGSGTDSNNGNSGGTNNNGGSGSGGGSGTGTGAGGTDSGTGSTEGGGGSGSDSGPGSTGQPAGGGATGGSTTGGNTTEGNGQENQSGNGSGTSTGGDANAVTSSAGSADAVVSDAAVVPVPNPQGTQPVITDGAAPSPEGGNTTTIPGGAAAAAAQALPGSGDASGGIAPAGAPAPAANAADASAATTQLQSLSLKQLTLGELLGDAGSIDVGAHLGGVSADAGLASSNVGGAGGATASASAPVSLSAAASTGSASAFLSPAGSSVTPAVDSLIGPVQSVWEVTPPPL
ncbi:MAG: Ig-like domain-containing protein [Lautropia sp.]|nr:Ig-like domain-containing protein [Lautropia sp.]